MSMKVNGWVAAGPPEQWMAMGGQEVPLALHSLRDTAPSRGYDLSTQRPCLSIRKEKALGVI